MPSRRYFVAFDVQRNLCDREMDLRYNLDERSRLTLASKCYPQKRIRLNLTSKHTFSKRTPRIFAPKHIPDKCSRLNLAPKYTSPKCTQ